MAGGHATSAGLDFQYDVAVWAATHILSRHPISELSSATPIGIRLEATSPVDDVVIETELGCLFVNVKTSVGISIDEKSALASVVDQFVRQWLSGCQENDRLVLVIKSHSRSFSAPIISVLNRLRDKHDIDGLTTTNVEKEAFDSLCNLTKKYWKIHTNIEPDNATLLKFFTIIRVVPLDMSGTVKRALETMLQVVTEASEDANQALSALKDIVSDYAKRRSGSSNAGIRDELRKRGISLKSPPEYQRDIQRLITISANTLQELSHYGYIPVKGVNNDDKIEISRVCTEVIFNAAKERSFLIIGEPGSGKSGALQSAAKKLIDEGHPILVLAVDQLDASNLDELKTDLGLEQPIIDVLSEWECNKTPVIFIDALDASRGGPADEAIRQLLRDLKHRVPHWNIVASIRKFDLRYGTYFQHIFDGSPINESFMDDEFRNVEHINVPTLNQNEIRNVCSKWARLDHVLNVSGPEFRKLLSSPFNLYLLALIFAKSTGDFNPARTRLDLLEQFWRWRVLGNTPNQGFLNEIALKVVVSKMMESRRLAIGKDVFSRDVAEDIAHLHQNGILVSPKSGSQISFAHHVLFDFILAKLILLSKGIDSLYQELTSTEEDVLLVAPAAMLAFQSLWNDEHGRESFWKFTFKFSANVNTGSFVKSLPAKAIVELLTMPNDLAPLIQQLSTTNTEAAEFLVRHIYGVLLAQVVEGVPNLESDNDPWCEITDLISEAATDKVIWPLNVALREWTDRNVKLNVNQAKHLGRAARRFLKHLLSHSNKYNENAIVAVLIATLRTINTDSEESERVLRPLFEADRIFKYGHKELFWVAQQFENVAIESPNFAKDILIAIFSSPLPSSDEATSMGDSRIMPLTSNKKQDFESVLYLLNQHLVWFCLQYPDIAADAIRQIITTLVERREYKDSNKCLVAEIGNVTLHLKKDLSYIWWNDSAHHYEKDAAVLDELVKALKQALKDDLSCFNTLAKGLMIGEIPIVIVVAIIKALNEYTGEPPTLAIHIASSIPLLLALETSYSAGELLRKLHPLMSGEEKKSIELKILDISDDNFKERLVSCLSEEHITERAMKEYYELKTNIKPLQKNVPPFELHTSWGGDDNWWLKSKGVNLETEQTKELLASIRNIENHNASGDHTIALSDFFERWKLALELLANLEADESIHLQLQNQGRDAIAELCKKICNACSNPEELKLFPEIRQAINSCLLPHLEVPEEYSPESEKQFEASASWGRPAPRIVAAEALMAFIRVNNYASEEDCNLIIKLAKDPAVEVRHAVLSRANQVCIAAAPLSKELARIAFENEKNLGVLTFFLSSYSRFMMQDINWATEKLLELDSKLPIDQSGLRRDLYSHIVNLLLDLWLNWDKEEARERIFIWVNSSLASRSRIQPLLSAMRDLIVLDEASTSDSRVDKFHDRGREIFTAIVINLISSHRELFARANRNENVTKELTECTRLLDSAAHEIYFGSKAYQISNQEKDQDSSLSPSQRRRFLEEYLPVMKLLASVPYPSVTHPLLETMEVFVSDGPEEILNLLIEAIKGGGNAGGYTFESLGADLVVRLVRRFLADYPSLISSTLEFRVGIVEILDQFAGAGWPEARKLVYELPEMLR